MSKTFVLYWKDGSLDIVRGNDLEDAYVKAGFKVEDIEDLDVCKEGSDESLVYDTATSKWVKPGTTGVIS